MINRIQPLESATQIVLSSGVPSKFDQRRSMGVFSIEAPSVGHESQQLQML